MTFAALRKACDQGLGYSTALFGEQVTYRTRAGVTTTPIVLIENFVPGQNVTKRDTHRPGENQRTDGYEYIRVSVCRDTAQTSGGLANEPEIGDTIVRAASRDSDTRAFVYMGMELVKEEVHAVYVFQRDTSPYNTRRTALA